MRWFDWLAVMWVQLSALWHVAIIAILLSEYTRLPSLQNRTNHIWQMVLHYNFTAYNIELIFSWILTVSLLSSISSMLSVMCVSWHMTCLRSCVQVFRNQYLLLCTDRRGSANSLVLHWSGSKKLLRLLEVSCLFFCLGVCLFVWVFVHCRWYLLLQLQWICICFWIYAIQNCLPLTCVFWIHSRHVSLFYKICFLNCSFCVKCQSGRKPQLGLHTYRTLVLPVI